MNDNVTSYVHFRLLLSFSFFQDKIDVNSFDLSVFIDITCLHHSTGGISESQ